MTSPFSVHVVPDCEALIACILRKGTPARVHHIELFLDREVQDKICDRFGVLEGLDRGDPYYECKRQIRLQSFLGYDFVRQGLEGLEMPLRQHKAADTAGLTRTDGRDFVDEGVGPITNWEEFEAYPWPDPHAATTHALEWYEHNLPDNMCVIGSGGFAHFAEYITWLMGYSTFCVALYEQRDLVTAIAARLLDMYSVVIDRILEFDRVKIIWGSDDMGFRGGLLMSPDDLGEFVLPGHKLMAQRGHAAGRPYLLHACGNLATIMDTLIDEVGIDAKHSFEDTIESVAEAKRVYGSRIALLGGVDLDFLCRSDESAVRRRVRDTLEVCMPGGGYCLGTGNSVANYVPVDNYLAMVDEGRRYSA